MYRVMIVDDEPLILAGISSLLEWEQHECRIVGKAVNGQQALEKMAELQPDIVITDIKMPAMDGIAFMKAAKARGDAASFIFLTNLEEFSLAKEAVHLGAVEYLVKLELTEEKLVEALNAAKQNCDLQSPVTQLSREELIRNYFQEVLVYDKEMHPDGGISQVIQDTFREPVVVLIHFNYGLDYFSQTFTRADQKKLMGFAEDIITEMVHGFFDHSCLVRRDQSSFILVLATAGVERYQEQIRRMAEKFLLIIKDYFEVSASVAVSLKGEGIGEFAELLYQVMSAMNHTYYANGEPIAFYNPDLEESKNHSSNFNISFLKKDLERSIRHNDSEQFALMMEQVIDLLREHKPSRPQAVNGCSNLYYFILSFFEDQDEEFPYSVDIISQLNHLESIKDIIRWIGRFRDSIVAVLDRRAQVRPDKHVALAQEYIAEHFSEKITLSQVADAISISQGHLSSTFKKQTGRNFSDYVNAVKIDKAKELIETHQYMMYEISDMLGFDTPYYFSTVFKKITGYTPKEYETNTVNIKI